MHYHYPDVVVWGWDIDGKKVPKEKIPGYRGQGVETTYDLTSKDQKFIAHLYPPGPGALRAAAGAFGEEGAPASLSSRPNPDSLNSRVVYFGMGALAVALLAVAWISRSRRK